MKSRKRSYDFLDQPCKRMKQSFEPPVNLKRCREESSIETPNKKMAMPSEYSDLRNEIMKLQISLNEMRHNQRMCYKIMAGQSAQIRQLEQRLHYVQNPVGEPWVQPLVNAN